MEKSVFLDVLPYGCFKNRRFGGEVAVTKA
jgi:hypothetical protein